MDSSLASVTKITAQEELGEFTPDGNLCAKRKKCKLDIYHHLKRYISGLVVAKC